jgi:hypothetical protein
MNPTFSKTDQKLKGSVITHLSSRDDALDGIEILPHKSPMIFDIDAMTSAPDDLPAAKNRKQSKLSRKTLMGNDLRTDTVSHLEDPQHIARVSGDQTQLAVSIASTIETPEQWVEFCEDVGGLKPILQCIHNVAEEIKQGHATEIESDDLLPLHNVDRFSTACSACKVLRDLCAKDQYWASAITYDILTSGTIVSDLVLLLKHANEAERIYSKKAWRQSCRFRTQGIYSTVRKTGKQRRGKKILELSWMLWCIVGLIIFLACRLQKKMPFVYKPITIGHGHS